MAYISPTAEQIKQFSELPDDGPVVMLNLLKFKPNGGRESYGKYSESFLKIMKEKGVRVIYVGKCEMPVIGDEDWDQVLLVEYPSRAVFLEMGRNKEYQEAARLRSEALDDSRLYATKSRT